MPTVPSSNVLATLGLFRPNLAYSHPGKGKEMREPTPATRTMKISDVKNTLSRLVNQVYGGQTRVLVEKSGIPVAAIISASDLARFAPLEREREERFAVIDCMRESFRDVPADEIEREAQRSVAAARERRRTRISEPAARSA